MEKDEIGGLLRNANLVENYPGFPEGIRGTDLASLFRRQLEGLGIAVTEARVTSVLRDDSGFRIGTGASSFRADAVIVATGTSPRRLGIRGESHLAGKRIFYGITELPVEGRKGREVVVIGGGDAAFDYALNLHGQGCNVTIASRSAPRCLGLLRRRVDGAGIRVMTGVEAQSVQESDGALILSFRGADGPVALKAESALVACGREPETGLLRRELNGGLKVKDGGPKTNIQGMYLVGDVIRADHRQTGIAVGDGTRAAMMVEGFIKKRRSRG